MKTQDYINESIESKIIIDGVSILKDLKRYKQVSLINKLRGLGYELSTASFSNILTHKKVGKDILYITAEGIQKLIKLELGLSWQDGIYKKNKDLDWEPTIVSELSLQAPSIVSKPGFAFHEEGRLPIEKKVEFFSTAQKEIIEFGVTLNTFVSYFISRRDPEYKSPVEELLAKGVNFKCYLLNPDCNEARLYFEDRKQAAAEEIKNIDKIKNSIRKLGLLQKEFKKIGYKGKFEIFTYKHIPYNYFMIVDGVTPNGKMMVSPYIYGVSRAKCPVIEIKKNTNYSLYKRYWLSLQLLTQNSKQIIAEK